jgi:hypothetical protein
MSGDSCFQFIHQSFSNPDIIDEKWIFETLPDDGDYIFMFKKFIVYHLVLIFRYCWIN